MGLAKLKSLEPLRDVHTLKEDDEAYVTLSWAIIRFKLAYYYPELVKEEYLSKYTISDADYDAVCKEYLRCCNSVGKTNNVIEACHTKQDRFPEVGTVIGLGMDGIEFNRSCVINTLDEIGVDGWRVKKNNVLNG